MLDLFKVNGRYCTGFL